MTRWFRFYSEALDDPKVQKLKPTVFKAWVNLLCLASKHGGDLPQESSDIAFALRISESEAANIIAELVEAGLLDKEESGCKPHNWDKRQHVSDSSATRVSRYRKRQRNGECNVTSTVTETVPERETDTESETERESNALSVTSDEQSPRKKPVRPFPEDFALDEELATYSRKHLPAMRPQNVFEQFKNYHLSKGNQFADWRRAFQNWVLREANFKK
jgi:DNA-binding Lrp family transcriptional regulator